MKWVTRQLGDVAQLSLGKMLDEKKNKGELRPYLANINVRWGEFELGELREMRFQEGEKDRFGLKYGDIVMCEGGESGRCAIWKDDTPGMMFQKALHRIRPYECLDSRFLFYDFLHKGKIGGFSGLLTGSTIKHLPAEKLAKLEIRIPEISQQRRIADVLSAYDDLMENNRRRMALLEESARLLYREWFVRLRFPGHTHTHTRVATGLPNGWERKTLGDICTDLRDTVSPDELESDTPYIGLEHMPRRSISLTAWGSAESVTSTKLRFKAGDIVFGKIRPYFHKVGVAFNEGVSSSDAIVMRAAADDLRSFVLMAVSSDEFVAEASQTMREGSKMPRADWKLMVQYPIALPPPALLARFEESIGAITDQLRNLCFQNQKLRTARDLLLPRLMSGEIAV